MTTPQKNSSSSSHSDRAHSKFSASGAERWMKCPGSVALSEGMPDKQNVWTIEGTQAHEVLEMILEAQITGEPGVPASSQNRDMHTYGQAAADFIYGIYKKTAGSEIGVEERIYLSWIHKEMFGTYDSKVAEFFGTLHVFDYKYGAGHFVSPKENLQMIFYALGVAEEYDWNFSRVRMWIIQPRVKGYDGPLFWEISIKELRAYESQFKAGVERVEKFPNKYVEGSWCHWCRAKTECPLKREAKLEEGKQIFGGRTNGKKKSEKETTAGPKTSQAQWEKETLEESKSIKSEADWKKEARQKKKRKSKTAEVSFF